MVNVDAETAVAGCRLEDEETGDIDHITINTRSEGGPWGWSEDNQIRDSCRRTKYSLYRLGKRCATTLSRILY